jgi:hypothetical protein
MQGGGGEAAAGEAISPAGEVECGGGEGRSPLFCLHLYILLVNLRFSGLRLVTTIIRLSLRLGLIVSAHQELLRTHNLRPMQRKSKNLTKTKGLHHKLSSLFENLHNRRAHQSTTPLLGMDHCSKLYCVYHLLWRLVNFSLQRVL